MPEGAGFERLLAACARVRGRVFGAAFALAFALTAALVLVLSFLPAASREGRGSFVPLGMALVLLGFVVVGVLAARHLARAIRPHLLAEEADVGAGLGTGDVRGALELADGSPRAASALAGLHRQRVSSELERAETRALLPRTGPRWDRLARRAAIVGAAAVAALAISLALRPQPTVSAAVSLGAPWRTAFPPSLPPLRVTAESGVSRGAAADLEIEAAERAAVTFVLRPAGDVIERRRLDVGPDGRIRTRTPPIEAPTRLWIEDDYGTSSDTLLVRPLEPLLVQDLRLELEYPAYLERPSESHRGQIPPLVAPEGTRLLLSGETNLPLDGGTLVWRPIETGIGDPVEDDGGDPPVELQVSGAEFGASWTPTTTGMWEWRLDASTAVGDAIIPEPIRVLVIPDLRPVMELLYPAPDTTLGFDQVMPLVVDVEDDIGLRRVVLRSWRSGLGADRAERTETLAPSPEGSRRVVLRHLLDRSADELLPGDTVYYQFEAFDGQPRRGPARSAVYTLRVPTFVEEREERAAEAGALAGDADALEEMLDRLARQAEEAARQVDADAGDSEEARFEATEEARAVLEDAEDAAAELADLEDALQRMREDLSESALSDAALQEQLERLAERYRELSESGLAEQMEALAEALREMDPDAVREALESLSENSEDLREQLEQTLGMLEQMALEQAMKSAQANAEELAEDQRELAERSMDAQQFAEEQGSLAEQAEELSEALDRLEAELEASGREMAADSAGAAGERTERAREQMEAAASEAAQQPQGSRASEQQMQAAAEAAEALEQASSALGSAQQEMSGENREAAVETLSRARAEALSLADEEARLAEATRGEETADPEDWRARQGAVRQGLENMLERLSEAGNEAAMLDQQTGATAGEAAERMDELLERLSEDGARRLPSRAEAEGIQDALNALAERLLQSEQAARSGQQESSGQEASEQMSALAQQQQGVTQETSSLLMPGPQPSGQDQQRMREELARRQQEIAEELGDVEDPDRELLGRPEELAAEAAELARQLGEQGPTQETLERQRQLFRRMLDAGRSMEDEDLDPDQRESETGRAAPREPPPIDPALLRGRRFPLPPEALLRDLPIVYRSLVFDYFDRLNRAAPRRDPPRDR